MSCLFRRLPNSVYQIGKTYPCRNGPKPAAMVQCSRESSDFAPHLIQRRQMPFEPNQKKESFFEPAYLDENISEIHVYDLLNVQMKGYDFAVLENYQKFVHKTADRFGLAVDDAWGTPCTSWKITKLKPESSAVESEFSLNLYERNVQLADVPSPKLPLFINLIEVALPAGIEISVHPHEEEQRKIRLIPDFKLIELKQQLEDLKQGKN